MNVFSINIFLTLVLISCISNSAPSTKISVDPRNEDSKYNSDELIGTTRIHLGEHEWNFSVGVLGGDLIENSGTTSLNYIGLRYSFRNSPLTQHDWQAHWGHGELLPLSYSYRTECCHSYFSNAYYKVGVYTTFQAADGAANFTELRRLKLFIAIGHASVIGELRNNGIELGLGYGLVGLMYYISYGISFYF